MPSLISFSTRRPSTARIQLVRLSESIFLGKMTENFLPTFSPEPQQQFINSLSKHNWETKNPLFFSVRKKCEYAEKPEKIMYDPIYAFLNYVTTSRRRQDKENMTTSFRIHKNFHYVGENCKTIILSLVYLWARWVYSKLRFIFPRREA